ncbi:MAG: rod shape-determining protein MreC [Candidatus Krumholzibacteriia bacterium]
MTRTTSSGVRTDTTVGVFCVLVALVLLMLPDRTQIKVAHVLSQVTVNPWLDARNYAEDVLRVKAENESLSAEVEALKARLAASQRAYQDAERGAGPAVPPGFIGPVEPCEVVARERARLATMIQIRSLRPLRWQPELPVITSDGLIGRLHTIIDERAAWVELLTAPDLAIGVEFERTGLVGVLRPRAGRFVVELVGRDEDVLPGDAVITSGLGEVRDGPDAGYFGPVPRGLRVGTVSHVSAPSDQVFKVIEIAPRADFRRNETVYVVGAEVLDPAGGTAP